MAHAIPEVKNFHELRGVINAVIDQDRRMHQLAHPRPCLNAATDVRETFEKLDVVQDGIAKPLGSGGKVNLRISEDFLKVG